MAAAVKPPESIVVGPHTYKVRTDDALRLRGEGRRGDSHPDQGVISLDLEGPHTIAAETLLHEITHCAWSQTALPAVEALEDHEEPIVRALAPLLLDALRSNPKLIAYLTS